MLSWHEIHRATYEKNLFMRLFACVLLLILSAVCYAKAQVAVETSLPILRQLAEINHSVEQDRTREAVKKFKAMIAQCKSSENECQVVETYFGFALALALNGNYSQSIRYHKKAIRLHKKLHNNEPLEMYINLGLTYYLADKDRKARKILGNTI